MRERSYSSERTAIAALDVLASKLSEYVRANASSGKYDSETVLEASEIMDGWFARVASLNGLRGYSFVVSGEVDGNLAYVLRQLEDEARPHERSDYDEHNTLHRAAQGV